MMRSSLLALLVVRLAVVIAPLQATIDFNFEGEIANEQKPLFVSLGSWCEIALSLRDCQLRQSAFPFDWLVTGDHEGFLNLFYTDFQYFTAEDHIIQIPDLTQNPNSLKNTFYNIIFYHEGAGLDAYEEIDKLQKQLELFKIKYTRRIARFRQLRDYPGKVFFIRSLWSEDGSHFIKNQEQAKEIKDALDRYFPSLDFTLVLIKYTDVNAPDIVGLEGVVEYKIERNQHQQVYDDLLLLEFAKVGNDLHTVDGF